MENESLNLVTIASICHEANRAYCKSIGDDSQLPWEEAPEWQKESAMAGVAFHLENNYSSPEDSHVSWLAEKEKDGWKYGPEKDVEKKEHPCFVPYNQLPDSQKMKDYIFVGIVKFFEKGMYDFNRSSIQTIGEQFVGVTFNPSKNQEVRFVKEQIADVINLIETKENSNTVNGYVFNSKKGAALRSLWESSMKAVGVLTS